MTTNMGLARRPIFLMMIVAIVAIAATACGGESSPEPNFDLPTPVYPREVVNFVVGAADGTFETDFANALSAAFAVETAGTVSVKPEPGSNGVAAVENFETNPRGGHWFLVINSDQIAALATGVTTEDITRDFKPATTALAQPFVFVAASDSDYSDWGDVVSAASSGSVTVGVKGSETGAAALNVAGIADALGLSLETTPAGDPAERLATSDGLGLLTLGEANRLIGSGVGAALLVLGPNEVASLAGVPTAASEGSSFEGVPYYLGISIHPRVPVFTQDNISIILRNTKASAGFQAFVAESGLTDIDVPAGDAGLTFRSQIALFEALAAK